MTDEVIITTDRSDNNPLIAHFSKGIWIITWFIIVSLSSMMLVVFKQLEEANSIES